MKPSSPSLSFPLLILLICLSGPARVFAADPDDTGSPQQKNISAEKIADGIWRVRLGTPEALVPTHFRSGDMQVESLKKLPAVAEPPVNVADIGFAVSPRGCAITLPMSTQEHVYGLGLSTAEFDKTDKRQILIPSDNPEVEGGPSHAPVPFYVSTSGYGVFIDTARYTTFRAGTTSPRESAVAAGETGAGVATSTEELYRSRKLKERQMLVEVPAAQGIDVYIFAGPQMADAVRRYNLFAGGGAVPPLWGLGMAYRGKGDFSAEDSLNLARSFRADGIPCDCWGIEPGWQTASYSCSFVWNDKLFPDPTNFVQQMNGLGYRLSFWEHCFTRGTSPMYQSLLPWSGSYRVWGGLVPDFALNETRKIFIAHHEQVLFSLNGPGAMKLDECDNQPWSPKQWSFPECSRFPSGLDGEQMHSLLGVLYQQTMLEPFQTRNQRTWGLVRNSQALAAPLPYVIYSDSYDHRCYVRGLANEGFSGLLWVPEVRDASSLDDLYRRIETVIFSPQALINTWYMKLPPWQQINRDRSNAGEIMPEHVEATAIVKHLFELRMSLVPYLYSAFNEYRLTGTPPVRALVMDYPADPKTYAADDEFLFGPAMLVAPLFAGEEKRNVYLPAGKWHDFWTDEEFAGGREIEVTKPANQIPLFVKDNSLIPLAAPVQHITKDTVFDLTVKVYGKNPGPFVLFEDDGESNDYLAGKQTQVTLQWSGLAGHVDRTGSYAGPARYQVSKWVPVNPANGGP
jgi:alpha-D-xyloside xylohydrolase